MLPEWARPIFNSSILAPADHTIDVGIEAKNAYSLARNTGSGVVGSSFLATGMGVARMTGAMDWAEGVNGAKVVQDSKGGISTQQMEATEIAVKAVTGAAGMTLTGVGGAKMLPGEAPVVEETPSLQQRANDIHSTLPERTQRATTTAVAEVENPDGTTTRLVGSSENSLRKAQRDALQPGETPVSGPGHAEETVINAAKQNNQTVKAVAASRPICPSCAAKINEAGATAASPLKTQPAPPVKTE